MLLGGLKNCLAELHGTSVYQMSTQGPGCEFLSLQTKWLLTNASVLYLNEQNLSVSLQNLHCRVLLGKNEK